MTTQPNELKDSIRLAIEAAAAANDATAGIEGVKAETVEAAEELRGFGRTMKPLLAGALIGSVLSFALGGLVYFRTLTDLRAASATQVEALALFAERVGSLDDQLTRVGAMTAAFEEARDTHASELAALTARLDGLDAALAATAQTLGETGQNMQSQFSRSILDAVAAAHEETRAAMLANASDLQLALTRLLAEGGLPAPATPAPAAARLAAQAQPASPPRSARPAAARRPAPPPPNPFSYP